MSAPIIEDIRPNQGPTTGDTLVEIQALHLAPSFRVGFGSQYGTIHATRWEGERAFSQVLTPAQPEGTVTLTLENLDAGGAPIPGELATLPDGFLYVRPSLVPEDNLTRVVRRLLQMLKAQVLANTVMTTAYDYSEPPFEDVRVLPLASLPSLIVSGPNLSESRPYSENVAMERAVMGSSGPEIERHWPALTVDLTFNLTVASDRSAELMNLMAKLATFINRNRWLTLPRSPEDPTLGEVCWELDLGGDFQTDLHGQGPVRIFTTSLIIRGFDIDEGHPRGRSKAVIETEIDTYPEPILEGGADEQ